MVFPFLPVTQTRSRIPTSGVRDVPVGYQNLQVGIKPTFDGRISKTGDQDRGGEDEVWRNS